MEIKEISVMGHGIVLLSAGLLTLIVITIVVQFL